MTKQSRLRLPIRTMRPLDTRRVRRNSFMRSQKWADIRDAKLQQQPMCEANGCDRHVKDFRLEVHHAKYDGYGGREKLSELVVLCRQHHQEVHDVKSRYGVTVEQATDLVLRKQRFTITVKKAA